MCRAITQEYANIQCRLIDLAPDGKPEEAAGQAVAALCENEEAAVSAVRGRYEDAPR